jgi:hypothetical protein
MSMLKSITVIGALAVGVLFVSSYVGSATDKTIGGGVPSMGGIGGIGSSTGGAKASPTTYNYNFPDFMFPPIPVLEMPEALVNEAKDEVAPTKKQVFSQKLGESTYPITTADKVFRDLISIRETGAPVGTKKEAVQTKPVGWGAYAPKQPTQLSDASGGMTKKQALLKERDEQDDNEFFGQYSGFFGGK